MGLNSQKTSLRNDVAVLVKREGGRKEQTIITESVSLFSLWDTEHTDFSEHQPAPAFRSPQRGLRATSAFTF